MENSTWISDLRRETPTRESALKAFGLELVQGNQEMSIYRSGSEQAGAKRAVPRIRNPSSKALSRSILFRELTAVIAHRAKPLGPARRPPELRVPVGLSPYSDVTRSSNPAAGPSYLKNGILDNDCRREKGSN